MGNPDALDIGPWPDEHRARGHRGVTLHRIALHVFIEYMSRSSIGQIFDTPHEQGGTLQR